MAFLASVNGIITPAEEARVSVLDNGFAFGDSVYEVLRTYGGLAFEPARHFRRLRASAARLGIEVPSNTTNEYRAWPPRIARYSILRRAADARNRRKCRAGSNASPP